jgi:acetyl-CoA synthetase
MSSLDDALKAFEAAADIGRNWAAADASIELPGRAARAGDVRAVSEAEAKSILRDFGLAVPEGAVCRAGEAAAVAERIGYPAALKVSSAEIAHKTEAGGVALNLRSRAQVEQAAARLGQIAPELLVERMVTGGVAELIVGIKRDPQFGLALLVGAGGVLTELLKDRAALLLPTNRREIETALRKLKVWRLVEGYRGTSGDKEAVVAAVEAVARFAAANCGLIEELDINPLIVLPKGAVAVDAFLRMRSP